MTAPDARARSQSRGLADRYGRKITYLRLSVTDRCDLRCDYCLPKGFNRFAEPHDWLTFDEIERVVASFVRLGVAHVRLTGGEPLLRRNVSGLAERLNAIDGLRDLSLSTNATQLTKHAVALKNAGVARLNISLDSLRADRVAQIAGRDVLQNVLDGIRLARKLDFGPIKLNMVAMRGVNDDEFEAMVEFCMENGLILRLIETMPIGQTGRNARHMGLGDVQASLRRRFGLIPAAIPGAGPARYLQSPDGRFSVGFITPISQHFCADCNRVRLSVDGMLYPCLGEEQSYALRPLLRDGADDADLEKAILTAIEMKPERHDFLASPGKIVRFMAMTGG